MGIKGAILGGGFMFACVHLQLIGFFLPILRRPDFGVGTMALQFIGTWDCDSRFEQCSGTAGLNLFSSNLSSSSK